MVRHSWIFLLIITLLAQTAIAGDVTITSSHVDGIYAVNEPIRWHIEWTGAGEPPQILYTIKKGQRVETGHGEINARTFDIDTKLDAPGTVLLDLRWKDVEGKEQQADGGAVVEPGAIKPSSPRPADFDAFWQSKLAELAAVPANPKVETADGGRKPGVQYFKVTLDNIKGSHIRGQLARPATGDKFPALLIVQWAGVYPLEKNWATDRAAEGWLCLNINAHDLPIDEPTESYTAQREGPLKDYWSIGNDDRETSYFLRMYLSCYRAAEFLTTRDDWDGKTLVVMGGSQGGLQSLMTAAIHPKITAALASVPAGCDMLGPEVGRKGGWPQWHARVEGKDAAKVHEASRYYDIVNFAPRIKCPVLIGVGLIDRVCPPEGIFAAANLITSPKEIVILPNGDHMGVDKSHAAYDKRCWEVWLPALRNGQTAPSPAGHD